MNKFSKIVENSSEELTKDVLEDYLQDMSDSGVQIYVAYSGFDYFIIHLYKYCVDVVSPFKELSELYDMFDELLNRISDTSNRFQLISDWGSGFPFTSKDCLPSLRGATFKYSIRIYTSKI